MGQCRVKPPGSCRKYVDGYTVGFQDPHDLALEAPDMRNVLEHVRAENYPEMIVGERDVFPIIFLNRPGRVLAVTAAGNVDCFHVEAVIGKYPCL